MEEKKESAKDTTAIVAAPQDDYQISPFSTKANFEAAWQMANCLSRSSIVPEAYQGENNRANCMIALELSSRLRISPFLVMQNMDPIQGRPSWRSTYLIASINVSGKFSPLRWRFEKKGSKRRVKFREKVGWDQVNKRPKYEEREAEIEDMSCVAWAKELATGDVLEGPEVSMQMAIDEEWYSRPGSKWKTMPEVMLRYRSAAFFCRMYCPEVAMGLHTTDENEDVYESDGDVQIPKRTATAKAKDLTAELSDKITEEEHVTEAQLHPATQDEPAHKAEAKKEAPKRAAKKEEPQTSHTTASAAAGQTSMDFGGDPDPSKFDIPPAAQAAAADTNAVEDGELF